LEVEVLKVGVLFYIERGRTKEKIASRWRRFYREPGRVSLPSPCTFTCTGMSVRENPATSSLNLVMETTIHSHNSKRSS
jgi:hypothetical protein